MKADRLFLERDCPHCGVIKAELDMEAVSSDDFRGKEDQELFVLASQSNSASADLLQKYGLGDRRMPVLLIHDGTVMSVVVEIMAYLTAQGMVRS
jgi:glutaredoxin